ncbi:MAG: class I SAM-dependent methyltransferase [Phyllobacteriaceae bacterium]|nr:class I SAM-dependent methyltransferase [Phyllobacteriaceae bacterium]
MSDDLLARVYAARTPEEIAAAYADWAATYDAETFRDGYHLPFSITAFVARHVKPGDGPLLDAGCGTGITGPVLNALGYSDIEGLDLSTDMLAIATTRGAYARLTRAELGKTLPYADGRFAAFLSTGVLTAGHAPASSLDELVRIVRPGGHAIFTVRDVVLPEFRAKMESLESAGRWTRLEESLPFRAFLLAEPEVLVTAFVFRVS